MAFRFTTALPEIIATRPSAEQLRHGRPVAEPLLDVACQEVGHTFGLDHNHNATDTCMNDWILTAGNQINEHDRYQLSLIYGGN